MYDREAGVIACDNCEDNIGGWGFSVSEDGGEPRGCYCWECACEAAEHELDENNKEVTIVRRSENWFSACYDLGVI